MDKKTIMIIIVLIFLTGCLSMVSAGNNTTENLTVGNIEDNLTNYIIPVYITDNGIEFSDGFKGFCIDSSKDIITVDDHFTTHNTADEEIQNDVKLAIIECYKAGKENNIQNVISQVLKGNKNYDVVSAVLNSTENVDDTTVVKINNTTEATFTFELLKSNDDGKSDCLAYKVSFNTIESDNVLAGGDNATAKNTTENNNTQDNMKNTTKNNNTTDNKTKTTENNTQKTENTTNNKTKTTENNTQKTENTTNNNTTNNTQKTENTTKNNNTTDNKTKTTENNTQKTENTTVNDTGKSKDKQPIANLTNKTEINQTNTVIENNTNTTISQNNTKIITKTNDVPHKDNVQDKIIQTVGNPVFILPVIIAIIAVILLVIRRKN